MARRTTKKTATPTESTLGSSGVSAANVYAQMENLQKELLQLAQRAELEIERTIKKDPAPVMQMLANFAQQIRAEAGAFWLEPNCQNKCAIDGVNPLQLEDSDKLQCAIALSGREMSFDFVHGRIFLPVVVFENPIAVAVFELKGLSSENYEIVCKAASQGICALRSQLRASQSSRPVNMNAAS